MKKHHVSGALGVGGVGLFLLAACGAGCAAESAATAVRTQALAATSLSASQGAQTNQAAGPHCNQAADDNLTLGMQHILPLLHLMPREAALGLHCDPNAVAQQAQICGEALPGSAQATWSSCEAPRGFHHGHPHGDDAHGDDAHGRHHGPPPSQGSLTLTASYTPDASAACDANTPVKAQRSAQFNIRMGDGHGPTMIVSGNNSETVLQTAPHMFAGGNITLDVNRIMLDANGKAIAHTLVTGTLQVARDPNASDAAAPEKMDPSTRPHDAHGRGMENGRMHLRMQRQLLSGTLTVNGDTVVLTHLAQHPGCMWPTAGSVKRTHAQSSSHTLVFTASCGSAVLDGTPVTLPDAGFGGHRAGGHPMP